MNKTWDEYIKEYKDNYIGGAVSFGIFILLLLYTCHNEPKKLSGLITSIVTIKKTPEYKVSGGKSRNYYVEIEINEDDDVYVINDIDYLYLDHKNFKLNINKGDTIQFKIKNNTIYSIIKHDKEFLDFNKSLVHKKNKFLCFIILFSACLILCIIPLIIKSHLTFFLFSKQYVIKYHFVFIIIVVLINIVFSILDIHKYMWDRGIK